MSFTVLITAFANLSGGKACVLFKLLCVNLKDRMYNLKTNTEESLRNLGVPEVLNLPWRGRLGSGWEPKAILDLSSCHPLLPRIPQNPSGITNHTVYLAFCISSFCKWLCPGLLPLVLVGLQLLLPLHFCLPPPFYLYRLSAFGHGLSSQKSWFVLLSFPLKLQPPSR